MGKERSYREERRTFPAYLSSDEHAREQRRTDEMVEGIMRNYEQSRRYNPREKQHRNAIEKIGYTENFCIEVDHGQKTVLLKEKEIMFEVFFKLSIKKDEVEDLVKLLTKSVALLG